MKKVVTTTTTARGAAVSSSRMTAVQSVYIEPQRQNIRGIILSLYVQIHIALIQFNINHHLLICSISLI